MRTGRIRVMVVDDQKLFRLGLLSFIEKAPEIEEAVIATDGEAEVKQAVLLRPDLAVINVSNLGARVV